jgi:hypothetical protein
LTSQLAAFKEETMRFVVEAVLDMESEVPVALVNVMFWKKLVPEKVLVFARRVEDAAVTVMFAVPSKEVPLMVRGVWSAVAVPAFPEMEPEMVDEKVLLPLKMLLSERSVELAAVTVPLPPSEMDVPFTVSDELASAAFATEPAVSAAPSTEPAEEMVRAFDMYASETVEVATTRPCALVERSADGRPMMARFVVVALVVVVLVKMLFPVHVLLV